MPQGAGFFMLAGILHAKHIFAHPGGARRAPDDRGGDRQPGQPHQNRSRRL